MCGGMQISLKNSHSTIDEKYMRHRQFSLVSRWNIEKYVERSNWEIFNILLKGTFCIVTIAEIVRINTRVYYNII